MVSVPPLSRITAGLVVAAPGGHDGQCGDRQDERCVATSPDAS